jgi:hypothetical protein
MEKANLKYFLILFFSERSTGRLSLVFELMEMNIYELIRGRRHYLAEKKVKLYMYQRKEEWETEGRGKREGRAKVRISLLLFLKYIFFDVVTGTNY